MVDVTVTYSDSQFFIVLFVLLWAFISALAYKHDDSILLYVQFFIQLPVTAYLLGVTFILGLNYGTGVGTGLLIASIYFVFLGVALSKKDKEG